MACEHAYIDYNENMELQATLYLVKMIGCTVTSNTKYTVISVILVF